MNIMNILGDIIIPIFSGIIFLVFAAYFLFSQSLTTKASRFFVIYLFSFGLFVLLRPVQLFLGPYPTPMYINTIRSFIMMSISIPCLVIANFSFVMPVKRNMTISFIAVGIVLGIVYGLFNSSAQESFIAFTVLGLPAYEPLLPASLPPLFAREVTIGVYVLGGMQVAASSFLLMYKEIKSRKKYNAMRKKFLMFGLGSLILGLSIIFGVLVKLWWIYYTASLFSSLLAGAGILADIRELQTRIDKTVPFIKGELANLVRFYRKNNNELFELLNILEYSTRINTCVLLECRYTASQENSLELFDILFHDIEPLLLHEAGENCFFLLPIGRYKIGICLALGGAKKQNKNASIELSERLLAVVKRRENLLVTAGIGRTKEDASGLSESYHEAATAQAYAAFFRKNQVVHIDDVQDPGVKDLDALFDFSDFSVSVKTGNLKSALQQFDMYFAGMIQASKGNLENLRMRSLHLVTVVVQDAMSVGISGVNLVEKSNTVFKDLLEIKEQHALRNYLLKTIEETVNAIALSQKNKLSKIVIEAKNMIDSNCTEQISSKDIAEKIGMSHSYLSNSFKKETGLTMNDYLNKQRISYARKLLAEDEKSITEVAYEVGFNDSNYFSTAFKRAEGMSPSSYRKSLKI